MDQILSDALAEWVKASDGITVGVPIELAQAIAAALAIPVTPAEPKSVPFTPADPKPFAMPLEKPLDHAQVCRAVIAAIMVKAGVSSLTLSQEDLTAVARLVLLDGRAASGDFLLALGMRDSTGTVHPFDPTITQGH